MTKPFKILFAVLLLLPIAGLLIHSLYLHSSISDAYHGNPDKFIRFLLNTLYPRFEVEKNRFDLNFFLQKSDQVVYRFTFIYYAILLLSYFSYRYEQLRIKLRNYFYTPTSIQNIDVLRCLFFSYLIYLSLELCHDLIVLQPVKSFYKPILWLRILHVSFPDFNTIIILSSIWTFLNILILVRIQTILCSVLSLIIFILAQSYTFSFEKMDHGYVTFTYAFLLIPFLLEEQAKHLFTFNSWSLQLIRITLAMVYFLSALEKLFITNLSWLNPATLKSYLSLHETYWSTLLIQYDWLCMLASLFTISFQLSFILIIFIPRYKWIWIVSGILFHYGTLVIMNIGHPLNPWVVTYIFFFDWTKIYYFLEERVKKINLVSN